MLRPLAFACLVFKMLPYVDVLVRATKVAADYGETFFAHDLGEVMAGGCMGQATILMIALTMTLLFGGKGT